MIPILYDLGETEFKSNGVGRLADAISCIVTEEKNGIYELQLTYPITGTFFKHIVPGAYLKAINGNVSNKQLFTIYKISKPLNGVITVYAQHISYALNKIVVSPFKASNVAMAFDGLNENASTDCPYVFWTDKVTDGEFAVDVPSSIRSRLGGTDGSILGVYGGEYEFDNYTVRLWNKRGQNRGVILRYGKNITDIKQEENIQNTITGVYPYWKNNDSYYELPNKVVMSENASNFPKPLVVPLDCSSKFEKEPSEQELTEYALEYLSNNNAGIPVVNISVSFINLAKTEEYKDIARLEEIELCDDVTVYFEKLNISAVAEVVETKYNVLKERYDSIQVGEAKSNLATNIANQNTQIKEKPSRSFLEDAIQNATNIITGVDGGYVVFHRDGNGKPYELLIMDTDDMETAKNVWRYNKNGWGYSSNGYNGPYALAATLDGGFVADFITAGTMLANRIKGGTLTLGGVSNGNGVARVLNSSGTQIVLLDQNGINAIQGKVGPWRLASDTFITEDYGVQITQQSDKTWDYSSNGSVRCSKAMWTEDTISAHKGITSGDGLTVLSGDTSLKKTRVDGNATVTGDFGVFGTKSRLVKTKSYNDRRLYCYEMPSPIFGDVGHGVIGEDGLCYIDIDQVFFETIDTNQSYQVFLQSYSNSQVCVVKKQPEYFVVKGTPNTEFDWELKVKQLDFPLERLDEHLPEDSYEEIDYVTSAITYLNEYEQEVLNYEHY